MAHSAPTWILVAGGVAAGIVARAPHSVTAVVAATAIALLAATAAAASVALRRPPGAGSMSLVGTGAAVVAMGAAVELASAVTSARTAAGVAGRFDVDSTGAGAALVLAGAGAWAVGLVGCAHRSRARRAGGGGTVALVAGLTTFAFAVAVAAPAPETAGGEVTSILRVLADRPDLMAAAALVAATAWAAPRPRGSGSLPLVWFSALTVATARTMSAAVPGFPSSALVLAGVVGMTAALAGPAAVDLTRADRPPPPGAAPGRAVLVGAAVGLPLAAVALRAVLGAPGPSLLPGFVAALAAGLFARRADQLARAAARTEQSARDRDRWYRRLIHSGTEMLVVVDDTGRVRFASPAVEAVAGRPPGEVLGGSVEALVDPADVDTLRRVLDSPGTAGQIRLRDRSGGGHWVEVSATDWRHDPMVAGLVVTARDVTGTKVAEAEIASAYDKQAAIAALGRAALAGADAAGLASLAVTQIQRTLGAEACELYRAAADVGSLLLESARGPLTDRVGELELGVGGGSQPGYALAIGETVLTNDVDQERRFDPSLHGERGGLGSIVSVVVRGRRHAYGVLTVGSTRPRAFGDADVAFLTTMANELALALERRTAEDETRHQALHDALTGLPNRAMFLNRLRLVGDRDGGGHLVGVLFADLDRFKRVNDSLGHDAGDQLLVQVAQRLRQATRPADTVARLGGDEFVVLCEELESVEQAAAIAARVRDHMDAPFTLAGTEVRVSASIGIAVTGATSDPAELLRDADAAMYKAKERGRARYEVFDFTMRDEILAGIHTETALHRALSDRQLVVHYQPIVQLGSGRLVGVEALVRWDHPELGLLYPDRFIAIAEKAGLIGAIGDYVLVDSCLALARWQREVGDRVERVSVNLSVNQLNQHGLVDRLASILADTGADPARLCLEITESALMSDVDGAMAILRELRELGVKIAVDDFGTGYSSLAYLRQLPIDILKIDREFVRGVATAAADRAIADTVITLARRLSLVSLAEGIELDEQADALAALGCDLGQGFLFGRPVAADEVAWHAASLSGTDR